MRRRLERIVAGLLLALAMALQAAPQFPLLGGRVVDEAGLLSAAARDRLEQQLAAHEKESSNQLVVVTLTSLQGLSIEEFGYQLGRHWGVGQQGRDNGVLLIVAPNEHRVRIEVGYGLEGALTDALSKNIIDTVITPRFKRGEMEGGITEGSQAILAAIAGSYQPLARDDTLRDLLKVIAVVMILVVMVSDGMRFYFANTLLASLLSATVAALIGYLFFSPTAAVMAGVAVFSFQFLVKPAPRIGGKYGKKIHWQNPNAEHSGSSSGGDGFSGGGGSFGGGGASGGW